MNNLINEAGRSGNISNIMNCSIHIYSHLMKFISVKPILKGWINTIKVQSAQLSEITNNSYWRDVTNNPSRLEKIKRDAIYEYEKDDNKNGEVQFNIVHNDFYDITKFKDISIIKNYMINHADRIKDQEIIDYINKELN